MMVFYASFMFTHCDIHTNAWSYRFHSKKMDTTVEYLLCCSLKSLHLITLNTVGVGLHCSSLRAILLNANSLRQSVSVLFFFSLEGIFGNQEDILVIYFMTSSASWQNEPNLAL